MFDCPCCPSNMDGQRPHMGKAKGAPKGSPHIFSDIISTLETTCPCPVSWSPFVFFKKNGPMGPWLTGVNQVGHTLQLMCDWCAGDGWWKMDADSGHYLVMMRILSTSQLPIGVLFITNEPSPFLPYKM